MRQQRKTKGRPRVQLTPDELVELRRAGLSFREIARRTGLGYGSVRRACGAEALSSENRQTGPDMSAIAAGQT